MEEFEGSYGMGSSVGQISSREYFAAGIIPRKGKRRRDKGKEEEGNENRKRRKREEGKEEKIEEKLGGA